MKKMIHPLKYQRQKRFFLVVPLIVIPFVIILFYLFGGGKGKEANKSKETSGLNVQLPDAHFKKGKDRDKLNLYELAERDSMKLREEIKNDPYYAKDSSNELKTLFEKKYPGVDQESSNIFSNKSESPEKREAELLAQMEQIKKELSKKNVAPAAYPKSSTHNTNPDIERLERMAKMYSGKTASEPDPEISEINQVLDKIMAIQHPEMVKDSGGKITSKKITAFEMEHDKGDGTITLIGRTAENIPATHNSFFSLDEEIALDEKNRTAIRAIIPEMQTLVSGSVIKIELMSPVSVQGVSIPAGHLIYGTTTLANERMKIEIRSVAIKDQILPVNLEVYDVDGMAGIYTPGNITREVAKESAVLGVNGLGLQTLDQSVGAQAASAGIQAARTLIGKKIKVTRVTVPTGYRVLLRNISQK